ncbi:MAG: helix-turn-helix domain-containing protein, partial [Clostridia bacterium]
VSGKAFSDVAKQNIYAENYALTTALSRFSDVMWVMQQIIFMSFDKRLAVFLDNEAEKTQSDFVKLTHEQVAKYIGSAREVVSRMLKYFVTENIVSLSRGGIKIIDREKLRSLAK